MAELLEKDVSKWPRSAWMPSRGIWRPLTRFLVETRWFALGWVGMLGGSMMGLIEVLLAEWWGWALVVLPLVGCFVLFLLMNIYIYIYNWWVKISLGLRFSCMFKRAHHGVHHAIQLKQLSSSAGNYIRWAMSFILSPLKLTTEKSIIKVSMKAWKLGVGCIMLLTGFGFFNLFSSAHKQTRFYFWSWKTGCYWLPICVSACFPCGCNQRDWLVGYLLVHFKLRCRWTILRCNKCFCMHFYIGRMWIRKALAKNI